MNFARTPTRSGVVLKFGRGPRTPSANRLAQSEQQEAVSRERGEPTAVAAVYSQSSRAWRTGGDRKIMFESGADKTLIPQVMRPARLVSILSMCSWFLMGVGLFQVVVSKLSDFKGPLHWMGVLLMFLGVVSMSVRVYTNRCGISPRWVVLVSFVTVVCCTAVWLVADGPLYNDVKSVDACGENLVGLCSEHDCACQAPSGDWDICLEFYGKCKLIPQNRRYILMSIYSLWVGIFFSFVVGVVSCKIMRTPLSDTGTVSGVAATADDGTAASDDTTGSVSLSQSRLKKKRPIVMHLSDETPVPIFAV